MKYALVLLALVFFVGCGGGGSDCSFSDPTTPRELAGANIVGAPYVGRALLAGNLAYIAADIAGMALLDLTDPAAPATLLPRKRTFNIKYPGR